MVHLEPDGTIWFDLFTKPMDAHNYLHHDSCHSYHNKKSLPYSQFLRIRRICTHNSDYDTRAGQLTKYFLEKGYPIQLLNSANERVCSTSRSVLLKPKPPQALDGTKRDSLFAITTFHPTTQIFRDTITDNWDLMGTQVPANLELSDPPLDTSTQRTSESN